MKFAKLEYVVLVHDIPEHGLRAGDLGIVLGLGVRCGDEVEVEFLRASGEVHTLLTLSAGDIRKIGPNDLLTTRQVT